MALASGWNQLKSEIVHETQAASHLNHGGDLVEAVSQHELANLVPSEILGPDKTHATAEAELLLHAEQTEEAAKIGKGFEFTPSQIELLRQHAEAQLDEMYHDKKSVWHAAQIDYAPAPDKASVTQAAAVKQALTNSLGVIESRITYMEDWRAKLVSAKAQYMENEHLNEEQWQRQVKGLDLDT